MNSFYVSVSIRLIINILDRGVSKGGGGATDAPVKHKIEVALILFYFLDHCASSLSTYTSTEKGGVHK